MQNHHPSPEAIALAKPLLQEAKRLEFDNERLRIEIETLRLENATLRSAGQTLISNDVGNLAWLAAEKTFAQANA